MTEPDRDPGLRVRDLFLFLIGHRLAIESVARCRHAWIIGVLFCLSAALAREYDGEDLLHEPWHLLRPLAASWAAGTALFLVVDSAMRLQTQRRPEQQRPFWPTYRSFISLFWMTAPLAWLYALPYERWLDPADAVRANLWTLTLVAAWRVLLITRALAVFYGSHPIATFLLVMLFADAVAIVVVFTIPAPVLDMMGGLRLSDREAVLAGAVLSLTFLSVVSAPVWLLGALFAFAFEDPTWPASLAARPLPRRTLAFALITIIAFAPALLVVQPEQQRRHKAEQLFASGELTAALAFLSTLDPDDLPPHYEPPPTLGYRELTPALHDVFDACDQIEAADWLAER